MKTLKMVACAVLFAVGPMSLALAETTAGTTTAVIDVGNKVCPVSGRKANPKYTTVYKGKRYQFCMEDCITDFNKDPEKYIAKITA